MAEERVRPAYEDRRRLASQWSNRTESDQVHASVDRDE